MHAVKFSRSERVALAKMLAGETTELEERPLKIFMEEVERLEEA